MTLRRFPAGIVLVLLAGVAARGAAPAAPAATPVPWLVIDPNGGYGMARYGYRDTARRQDGHCRHLGGRPAI